MKPLLADLLNKGRKYLYWQIQFIVNINLNFSIRLKHLKKLLKGIGFQYRFSDIDFAIIFYT